MVQYRQTVARVLATTAWGSKGYAEQTARDIVMSRLRILPENRICFNCEAEDPEWMSLVFAVFICFPCSRKHATFLGEKTLKPFDAMMFEAKILVKFEIAGNLRARIETSRIGCPVIARSVPAIKAKYQALAEYAKRIADESELIYRIFSERPIIFVSHRELLESTFGWHRPDTQALLSLLGFGTRRRGMGEDTTIPRAFLLESDSKGYTNLISSRFFFSLVKLNKGNDCCVFCLRGCPEAVALSIAAFVCTECKKQRLTVRSRNWTEDLRPCSPLYGTLPFLIRDLLRLELGGNIRFVKFGIARGFIAYDEDMKEKKGLAPADYPYVYSGYKAILDDAVEAAIKAAKSPPEGGLPLPPLPPTAARKLSRKQLMPSLCEDDIRARKAHMQEMLLLRDVELGVAAARDSTRWGRPLGGTMSPGTCDDYSAPRSPPSPPQTVASGY